MNHAPWRLCLLLLMAAAFQCLPNTARANTSNVSCTATSTGVTFGNIDPTVTGTIPKNGSVQFTCQNSSLFAQKVTLCIGLDQGTGNTITPTRQMSDGAGHDLNFQVYKDGALSEVWGNVPSTSNPSPQGLIKFTIPAFFGSYTSPPATVYVNLVTPQVGVPVGSYANNLNGQLTYAANTSLFGAGYPATCDGGGSTPFSLPVQANVPGQCAVTAGSDLNLGSVPSTATNLTGNNSISVTCTLGTPYYIGLSPSNGNTAGAGLMLGTNGGNTDKVLYQLRSSPGLGGTIWGNTATATSVGNGVAGTGNGNGQSITVYATVPSTNYTPDTYTDLVTVYVNY